MASHSIEIKVGSREIPTFQMSLNKDVAEGTLLRFKTNDLRFMSFTRIESVGVILPSGEQLELPIVQRFSREAMRKNWNYFVRCKPMITLKTECVLPAGSCLSIDMAFAGQYEEKGSCLSGLAWSAQWITIEDEDAAEGDSVSELFQLITVPGDASKLQAWMHADGRVSAGHRDVMGNPTGATDEKWVARASGFAAEGTFSGSSVAVKIASASDGAVGKGERISVMDCSGRVATTNARPVTGEGQSIYFGEFHWHCDHSGDGERALVDALASARDELGLDFAGPSDHMKRTGQYADASVERQVEIMRDAERPGTFVGLPGAELSGRYGHANFYNDSYEHFLAVAQAMGRAFDRDRPSGDGRYYWDTILSGCREVDLGSAMLIPHHTNMDSYVVEGVVKPEDNRPYWAPMTFPQPADRELIRGFEIFQVRGSFEAELPDPKWRGEVGGFGSSYHNALMRGYRMGVTGGTDNHQGWPSRSSLGGVSGLTAVLADTLTTRSIFEGIYQRHTYATTGARIVADVTLNGLPIGSELLLAPNDARLMKIRLQGTAPWESVQIISAGVVLADLEVSAGELTFEAEWSDPRPGRPCTDIYYYLRARQVDGHCLWCSPFWIDMSA